MSAINYAWEFTAEIQLLQLQHLQNWVLCTTGNFPRKKSVREMLLAFQVPYVYDCITKLCRRQAEFIHNHENICRIEQGETPHRKYKRLKLGGHVYVRSSVLDCHGSFNNC
jgi:hypothetical protein